MELLDAIKTRKTIKAFQENVEISRQEWATMLSHSQLAPSKANLQPWRFVVVDDPNLKQTLSQHVAFNGPPCATASNVVLVLADLHYERLLGDILDNNIQHGCLGAEFRERSFAFLTGVHNASSPAEIRDQVLIDSSLAAMQLMLIIKDHGYDSHAIGIFDRQAVLDLLKVDSERYAPVMLLAVGKAATEAVPSVRLPLDYTISWNDGKGFKSA